MRILFVCTGNICRSPVAERLTRAFLDDVLGPAAAAVRAHSAGTHAAVGAGMEPTSALVLAGLGGSAAGFRARRLTDRVLAESDLTLTMTRRHRQEARALSPPAAGSIFTLREAAALLDGVDVGALPPVTDLSARLRALVRELGRVRAERRRPDLDSDDVPDPIGQQPEMHQSVADQMFASLLPLLEALCGTGAPGPGPSRAPAPTTGGHHPVRAQVSSPVSRSPEDHDHRRRHPHPGPASAALRTAVSQRSCRLDAHVRPADAQRARASSRRGGYAVTTFAVRGTEPSEAPLADLLPGREALVDELADQLPFASAQAITLVLLGVVGTAPLAGQPSITQLITGSLRGDDWIGRLGPDEFALVVAAPVDDAHSIAARVMDAIAANGMPGLVAAAGLAELSADLTPAEALHRATASLELARSQPRDRIVRHRARR